MAPHSTRSSPVSVAVPTVRRIISSSFHIGKKIVSDPRHVFMADRRLLSCRSMPGSCEVVPAPEQARERDKAQRADQHCTSSQRLSLWLRQPVTGGGKERKGTEQIATHALE